MWVLDELCCNGEVLPNSNEVFKHNRFPDRYSSTTKRIDSNDTIKEDVHFSCVYNDFSVATLEEDFETNLQLTQERLSRAREYNRDLRIPILEDSNAAVLENNMKQFLRNNRLDERLKLKHATRKLIVEMNSGIYLSQFVNPWERCEVHCQLSDDCNAILLSQNDGRLIEFPLENIKSVEVMPCKAVATVEATERNENRQQSGGLEIDSSGDEENPTSNTCNTKNSSTYEKNQYLLTIQFASKQVAFIFEKKKLAERFKFCLLLLHFQASASKSRESSFPWSPRSMSGRRNHKSINKCSASRTTTESEQRNEGHGKFQLQSKGGVGVEVQKGGCSRSEASSESRRSFKGDDKVIQKHEDESSLALRFERGVHSRDGFDMGPLMRQSPCEAPVVSSSMRDTRCNDFVRSIPSDDTRVVEASVKEHISSKSQAEVADEMNLPYSYFMTNVVSNTKDCEFVGSAETLMDGNVHKKNGGYVLNDVSPKQVVDESKERVVCVDEARTQHKRRARKSRSLSNKQYREPSPVVIKNYSSLSAEEKLALELEGIIAAALLKITRKTKSRSLEMNKMKHRYEDTSTSKDPLHTVEDQSLNEAIDRYCGLLIKNHYEKRNQVNEFLMGTNTHNNRCTRGDVETHGASINPLPDSAEESYYERRKSDIISTSSLRPNKQQSVDDGDTKSEDLEVREKHKRLNCLTLGRNRFQKFFMKRNQIKSSTNMR